MYRLHHRALRSSSFILLPSSFFLDDARPEGVSEVWAHQDSNLGQAGYEPAALTAELWARRGVYQKVDSR